MQATILLPILNYLCKFIPGLGRVPI